MNIKNAIKNGITAYSFTRQKALKMGHFYWLCVENSNHLYTEINLGYLKATEFYLENKAFFIHISSIASFKPFLVALLWEYCTFSDSSVVSLKSSSWPKYTQYRTIFQKNHVLLSIVNQQCVVIVLYVICAMQIMSAIQPDTFFNVSLNTKIRQLASIFMKRMVGGIVWVRVILRFWESVKGNLIV